MSPQASTIIWTLTDEAPYLASYSLLPVFQAYTRGTGITFTTNDISLAGRIIASFPDKLPDNRRIPDYLNQLGELVLDPKAIIIKLPNISASIPQLKAAISELQSHGYPVPDYPEEPKTDADRETQARYARVLGSAVNPVLRQGNSDRRAPLSVKQYARKYPESMGLRLRPWAKESKTRVAHMENGDFYGNEKSVVMSASTSLNIEFAGADGTRQILKKEVAVDRDEIVSGTFMSRSALRKFYADQIAAARTEGLLLSLHLKATMMKVSDPIIFGHAVSVYYEQVFRKHGQILNQRGVNPNNGLGDLYAKIATLPPPQREAIEADIAAVYRHQPALAMVDSDKGITNLHVPSDIIIDASLPPVIRDGGIMWNPAGKRQDTLAMIPDRCYATMYQKIIEDCQAHGAFDRATMGSVPNVGLMAQKAEEYGSHLTTFEMQGKGTVRVIDAAGSVLMEHAVEAGDIWRLSRVKDIPIQDWIRLAVRRVRATGVPGVFWLDRHRAHDAQVIAKVTAGLKNLGTDGLEFHIMAPAAAMEFSLARIREGKDTISITGNVLRDYLTDLFPILELGTSAKMLSIVPLLAGGGLFETGAGGSAPKHVQQFQKERHLRWDSLGEFSAVGAAFEHIASLSPGTPAQVLADTLDRAIEMFLEHDRSPGRDVGELDTRGSHFYLALYWAKALADQDRDSQLKGRFEKLYRDLAGNEEKIINELNAAQGQAADLGGYYHPDPAVLTREMRPSATLNAIIDSR